MKGYESLKPKVKQINCLDIKLKFSETAEYITQFEYLALISTRVGLVSDNQRQIK